VGAQKIEEFLTLQFAALGIAAAKLQQHIDRHQGVRGLAQVGQAFLFDSFKVHT
jgi:hypothetical protein